MTVYRDEEEIGAVLFSAETDKSFGMNVVAEIIWENASPGADREHVFFILRREFSEVPESARDDIGEILSSLLEPGFLSEQP